VPEVRVDLEYDPPAGSLGATVAKLFGEEPGQQIEEDLERFKKVLETGDTERPYEHSSGISDVGARRQDPVEQVHRVFDRDARI
jgi:uncharacterized membrane protein